MGGKFLSTCGKKTRGSSYLSRTGIIISEDVATTSIAHENMSCLKLFCEYNMLRIVHGCVGIGLRETRLQ